MRLRDDAVRAAEAQFREGKFHSFEDCKDLLEQFDEGAVFDEGYELDGEGGDREVPLQDAEDCESSCAGSDEGGDPTAAGEECGARALVPLRPDDDTTLLDLAEAEQRAQKMRRFDAMEKMATSSGLEHLLLVVQKEKARLEKERRAIGTGANRVIGRWLRDHADMARERIAKARTENEAARAAAAEAKRKAAERRIAEEQRKLDLSERKKQLDKDLLRTPTQWELQDFGQGHKNGGTVKHHENRPAITT